MRSATKSLNYWRSELWETQYYCSTRNRAAERRDFKRRASKARRKVDKAITRTEESNG